MPIHRVFRSASSLSKIRQNHPAYASNRRLILIALCLSALPPAHSQQKSISAAAGTPPNAVILPPQPEPIPHPVASEISIMGMVPDGDYRLFSATTRVTAWTVSVEYDRHSWGHLLKSQIDYVAEAVPFILLSQPAVSDFWGNGISPNQKLSYGLSLLPVGLRFIWRSNANVRPYVSGKLGATAFTRKAFSPKGSYANFNIQAAFGVEIRLSERIDLRVEPFEFFHISNGYLAASNPGMDQLASQYGISYHLGKVVQ